MIPESLLMKFKVGDRIRFKDGTDREAINKTHGHCWPIMYEEPSDFEFEITEVEPGWITVDVWDVRSNTKLIVRWFIPLSVEDDLQLITKQEDEVPMKVTYVKVSSASELAVGDKVRVREDFGNRFEGEGVVERLGGTCLEIRRADGVTGGGKDGAWNLRKGEAKYLEKKTVLTSEMDFSHMHKVVMSEQNRTEIISVLKQHKHAKKLFEDWGLGEVIEYGKGMTFLFYGPPGTGKTWAAHCIAKTVDSELLVLSAAEVQSSEPGGANRAIQQAFAEAKSAKKVLFIDECDSLVQSRTNLGMVLGSEVNTLLTEIEKFEGIAILATNMVENLDEALERRISLMVEFPKPKRAERRLIWDRMLPAKMPLGKDVDKEELSKAKLTGGQIKNVILNAARLAIASDAEEVSKANFDAAIARLVGTAGLMGSDNWSQDGREDVSGGKKVGRGKTKSDDVTVDKVKEDSELEELLG